MGCREGEGALGWGGGMGGRRVEVGGRSRRGVHVWRGRSCGRGEKTGWGKEQGPRSYYFLCKRKRGWFLNQGRRALMYISGRIWCLCTCSQC